MGYADRFYNIAVKMAGKTSCLLRNTVCGATISDKDCRTCLSVKHDLRDEFYGMEDDKGVTDGLTIDNQSN